MVQDLIWNTGTEWGNASKTDIEVVNDTFQLATLPSSEIYDFESGSVSAWDSVWAMSASTSQAYNGSWSGFADNAQSGNPQARTTPPNFSGGMRPTKFRYYYYNKTSGHSGHGMRLINSSGQVEIGVAEQSPGWLIDRGQGWLDAGSPDGEGRWVEVVINFDWPYHCHITFTDLQTGRSNTENYNDLKQTQDVEKIQFDEFNNDGGTYVWQSGNNIATYIDDVEVFL